MSNIVYLDEPSYLPPTAEAELRSLGSFKKFGDRPDESEAIRRLKEAEVAIVEWTSLPAAVFREVGNLHDIVLVTTGFSYVDVDAARRAGVNVSNTPDYSRQSVAEHAFALTLSCAKRIPDAVALTRENLGAKYTDHSVGVELYGRTIGILGLGSIGTWVAKIAQGFGMNVLTYTRSRVLMPGVSQASLDTVLKEADVIVVCLPHSAEVRGLLDASRIALLKEGAILVNISGNDCLDEPALSEALSTGRVYGVGLDEPTAGPLAGAPHLLMTPGIAWYTQASLDRNISMVIETVRHALEGTPRFVVNR